MAYIVWRVILKKYAKIRLGVQRNLSVNGRDRDVEDYSTARGGGVLGAGIRGGEDDAVSCPTSRPGSIALSTSGEFPAPSLTEPLEESTLSNKARRKKTRNYLKRRSKKSNSIAPSSDENLSTIQQKIDENETTEDTDSGFTVIRNRNTRRKSNIIHHNRSSWYIEMGSKESHIINENHRPRSMVQYVSHNNDEDGEVVLTNCIRDVNEDIIQPSINEHQQVVEEVVSVEVEPVTVDTGQYCVVLDPPPCQDPAQPVTPPVLKEDTLVHTAGDQNNECVTPVHREELRRLAASLASLDSISSVLSDSTITANDEEETPLPPTSPAPPCTEVARDVSGLVAALLGPLYPNFARSRLVLTRQARDLLVCRYYGNLARFETEFLRPAAALLTDLKDLRNQTTVVADDDVTIPHGWPFSLGTSGVILHLGELENAAVRARDCYLCVRPCAPQDPSTGVEVALVWRGSGGGELRSRALTSLAAPSAMEELATSDEGLVCLLHSVLVSVERAIERVPLDQLTFPCPCSCECPDNTRSHPLCQPCTCGDVTGHTDCTCKCHNVLQNGVEKKDSSMQTLPPMMFDFVNSIPHIDSDSEDENNLVSNNIIKNNLINNSEVNSRLNGTTVAVNNIVTVQVPPPPPPPLPGCEEPPLMTPGCVAELPPDHLAAGVTLTDSVDVDGRPIVVFEALAVQRAALQRRDVARLLLFYASILSRRKESREVPSITILIPRIESAASLELLDQSLLLTQSQLRVCRAVLRKQAGGPTKLRRVLPETGVKLHVVGCEAGSLRRFVTDAQLPRSCGGEEAPARDHIEWFAVLAEAESLSAACHGAGRRLASALADLRDAEAPLMTSSGAGNTGTLPSSARRLLHHQHRVLSRALAEPTLQETRSRGATVLQELERRVRDTCADCQDLRRAVRRAATLLCELERAAQRLERLAEGRRERLRDLARLRALEDETSQELSWLREKGEEALRRHAELATNLSAIKTQELDFDKFYFIAMRHLDRGGDLVEEAALQPPGTTGAGNGGGALHNLARSLKQHLRGFSDRLEDTRERLEDTSRCFYLLDKAYEWALEAKKYVSRTETATGAGPEQSLQALKQLQHYLMAHPAPCESHFTEMAQLARKLANDKLAEQCKVAHSRCQETLEVIRAQRARLAGGNCLEACTSPLAPGTPGMLATSTPLSAVRRRSLPAAPTSAICAPFSAGHSCGCWETASTTPTDLDQRSANCSAHAAASRPLSLGDIKEVRESAENLLENEAVDNGVERPQCDNMWCKCETASKKHVLRRACTWQHPTENFEEDEGCRHRGADDGKCDNCSSLGESHSAAGDSTPEENTDESAKSNEERGSSKGSLPPVPVNSHLHHHASSLDLPINADDSTDPRDIKTQKTLLLIMREMIQTERDYVRSLEYVIENFIPELMREDIPQAMRGQRNVVFGNIEKIYEFHSQFFLQELEKCEARPLAVGQSFLRHENKFYLYALYNKNKPKSDSLMSEYGTSFFRKKQLELGDRMDLASYLLKPVQRMGKYALLLQQLVKAQGERGEATQVADLRAAEAMVRFQLRHGNDLLAMDSLRDCDINVKEQGRLLRQNEFLVWQGKGKKCLRHVFLFEELILFSKARRFPDRKNLDLYIYKNSMKMTDIGLTALVAESSTKFEIWFRKRKPNDTFVLQTMSEEVKQVWTEEISRLLWKQALRNREVRMVEMSSMGIGNKPCLDIRPSADQISDRSISIAQLSKTAPRFRNSVVLGSGEQHVRSRRPHSIISVGGSSTASSSSASGGGGGGSSSGGSCGSCHSNYGTLNLDESPSSRSALHHRSGTLHSQCSIESGIIADMSLSSEEANESSGGGPGHWLVERSNSSATSASLDSSLSPSSPLSPLSPLSPVMPLPGQGEEVVMSVKL